MRRIRYSVAMSLDGYIAGPKGEYDWIVHDPDIDFSAIGAQFDTLLMGRGTYQPFAGQGGAGPFSHMRVVVVSRTLRQTDHPDVTIVNNLTPAAIDALRDGPGKDIWLFGGGDLFRSLLAIDRVDTVEVAVIPVVIGGGIPLLPSGAARTSLKLSAHRIYPKTGIVALEYAVTRGKRSKKK